MRTGSFRPSSRADAQAPQLGLEVEAGARLALERGHAAGDQLGDPRGGGGVDLLVAGRPGLAHEAPDTAARRDHVGARAALGEQLEVAERVAVVHGVVVGVDQSRRQQAATEVVHGAGARRGRAGQRRLSTDPGDATVLGGDRAVLDQAERPSRARRHRRHLAVPPQGIPHRIGLPSRVLPESSRMLKKPHLLRSRLSRTLNVQRVRLACGHRAPPRIWTFLSILLADRRR